MGTRLADELDVSDADTDGLGFTDRDTGWLGVTGCDTDGLALVLGETLLGETLTVGVGERVPAGENDEDGPADGVDPEQAETAAEARTMPQPMRANLALRPVRARAVGTFIEPPRSLPGPAKGNSLKALTTLQVKPVDGTDPQWPNHSNIRLRE